MKRIWYKCKDWWLEQREIWIDSKLGQRLLKVTARIVKWTGAEAAIGAVSFLVTGGAFIWIALFHYEHMSGFWQGIVVETGGFVLDIALFGVLIAWFQHRSAHNERIRRYHEELSDYRGWKSEEGARRTRGLVLRLSVERQQTHFPRNLNLHNADLIHANLFQARFEVADLAGANLIGANLGHAWLLGADLTGARLFKAKLYRSKLEKAKLVQANFVEADLRWANFYLADLSGANLRGADIRGAYNLTCDQLKTAKNWESAYRDDKLACEQPIPEPPEPMTEWL